MNTNKHKQSNAGHRRQPVNRGRKQANLVNAALVRAVQDQQGQLDGLEEKRRELMEEKEISHIVEQSVADISQSPTPVSAVVVGTTHNVVPPVVVVHEGLPSRQGPSVPGDPYGGIRARALAHFATLGHSEKTLQAALAKTVLWMDREQIKLTDSNVISAHNVIWSVYESRYAVGGWFARIKLAIYDYLIAVTSTGRFWAGIGALGIATVAAAGWFFGFKTLTTAVVATGVCAWRVLKWLRDRDFVVEDRPYLEDYCTGTTEHSECVKNISETATLTAPTQYRCEECKFAVGFTICPDDIWLPRLCTHNEINALSCRQLLPPLSDPKTRAFLWAKGQRKLTEMLPPVNLAVELSGEEKFELFLEKYPTARREQLRQAYQKVNGTYHIRECRTKAFVKREWLTGKIVEKRNPRLISGKTDEYLAETAPEYYHFMKSMCSTYWPDVTTALQSRFVYTGGWTGDMIGLLFTHFVELGWAVFEYDYSRYDGHNEEEAIGEECEYYLPVLDADTRLALQLQLETKGTTSSGVKFSCRGKVASGVINTSFGNTLRGFMIVSSYVDRYKIPVDSFTVMQLGDDNIIFAKSPELWNAKRFEQHCLEMGHKAEGCLRPDPDFAEYCSMRFWNTGDQYVLGPKPGRILAKTFVCHDPSLTTADMESYCVQIAQGFSNYRWVPVLGSVIEQLVKRNVQTSKAATKALKSNPYRITLKEAIEVDWASVYTQFNKIYGVDPRHLEEYFTAHKIEMGKAILHPTLRHIAEVDGAVTSKTWL